jgi:(2R)-3-sulfolactate dehydrogenase (NADP+)
LLASRASEANARCMARSIAAAEAEGLASHGLLRVPPYCQQVASGKIDGHAVPTVTRPRPGALLADARTGFAHPAIELGFEQLVPAAKEQGVAVLAITNSYNCGVVGHHVERLADAGLVALAFANTPSAIAPWGGSKALFGTNPLGFAAPRASAPPLVIDQSSSVVARGEVMLASLQEREIPLGWALDSSGTPTTDPRAALAGSMLPAGGYKGAGIALIVEVLAAVLTGANFSFDASSFADEKGGPPRTGQLFIAIDPVAFLGDQLAARMEVVLAAMCAQPGVRLPGERRIAARTAAAAHGVAVKRSLYGSVARLGSAR